VKDSIVIIFVFKDGWILSTGLNSGVAKIVGEAISQAETLKSGRDWKITSIGLTKWGTLTEETRNLLSEKVQ